MSASGITIMVNGESVDLNDVSWYVVAPCGCTSGVTIAWLPAPYNVCAVTAEQAWAKFHETKAEREQDERRGFTVEADLRTAVTERMTLDCPHTPKWGYERPTPDGMEWAPAQYGRGRLLHLVPTEREKYGDVEPLCGGKASYGWDARFRIGKPDCEKCIKRAVALRDAEVTS